MRACSINRQDSGSITAPGMGALPASMQSGVEVTSGLLA